jgi:hypothetical protein
MNAMKKKDDGVWGRRALMGPAWIKFYFPAQSLRKMLNLSRRTKAMKK